MTATPALTLALFCKVVDNYGDIGICWRLARQLQREHGVAVTLWVDDLASFQRICPALDAAAPLQHIEQVEIRHWIGQGGSFAPSEIADIVIEFFACDIPPGYIEAMAQCLPRPVWLNLEGLSAEEWVEGCHLLPSMHPRLPLTKHFFFPGFTAKTGGLLWESGLEQARRRLVEDPAALHAFLARLGLDAQQAASLKVSMFCYPEAPVAELFSAWQTGNEPVCCLVPEGVARAAVEAFLGAPATVGASARRGALSVRVIPFVAQPDYDSLLWACDVNFVRGEDSFVRAQLAGKPFVWHIYPQDEQLHHKKLRAFLGRYANGAPELAAFMLRWNGAMEPPAALDTLWRAYAAAMPGMQAGAQAWRVQMQAHGDMASNLLAFATKLRLAQGKT
ncbi:MAG: elongation factor P maturation arginine rhamnosyltransferase EarP [Pseudomonadota bacterium]